MLSAKDLARDLAREGPWSLAVLDHDLALHATCNPSRAPANEKLVQPRLSLDSALGESLSPKVISIQFRLNLNFTPRARMPRLIFTEE